MVAKRTVRSPMKGSAFVQTAKLLLTHGEARMMSASQCKGTKMGVDSWRERETMAIGKLQNFSMQHCPKKCSSPYEDDRWRREKVELTSAIKGACFASTPCVFV